MAHVSVRDDGIDLDSPTLVEGLPGVGLVGKLAADHLVETLEMDRYADVYCDGLPKVAIYGPDDRQVRPPVRLYADADRDLVVLQSDVPVSPSSAEGFTDCLIGWFRDNDVTPIYVTGRPRETEDVTASPETTLRGVAVGDALGLLDRTDIEGPGETGAISGPTGALVHQSIETGLPAVCLIAETDPRFPDPTAAKAVIEQGVAPMAGIEVSVDDLVSHAKDLRRQKEQLARRMGEAEEESSKAQPLRMYQ